MKATTTANTNIVDDTNQEAIDQQAAEVGLGVIVAVTAVSGLWGATCLLSALAQNGAARLVAGWLEAIGGG
ncbi:MAG: hypothetical protein KKC76_16070 [Proteobacteria bacterium]|nr:hypothetical protein [Pseudomonadota bacterium]MBU4296307.1 hypothetical protein [Pseudomonadota bacterium]MCG2746502.1 hypothetical protein [Desulfobulbaceae bacterium]